MDVVEYTGVNADLEEWCSQIDEEGLAQWCTMRKIRYMAWQLERCPTSGRLHIQMSVCFQRKVSRHTVQIRLGAPTADCRVRAAPVKDFIAYSKKEASRVAGPWEWGDAPVNQGKRNDIAACLADAPNLSELELYEKYPNVMVRTGKHIMHYKLLKKQQEVLDRYEPVQIVLRPWQQKIVAMVSEPKVVRRRIIWAWSSVSRTGKSTFMQYLTDNFDCLVMCEPWKEFLHAYRNAGQPKVVVYNLPRHQELTAERLAMLERISDGGKDQSVKYDGGQVIIASHLVVFANIRPPEEALPDRFGDSEVAIPNEPIPRDEPLVAPPAPSDGASTVPYESSGSEVACSAIARPPSPMGVPGPVEPSPSPEPAPRPPLRRQNAVDEPVLRAMLQRPRRFFVPSTPDRDGSDGEDSLLCHEGSFDPIEEWSE
jgi:hypothetical protein